MEKINIRHKLSLFEEEWTPKIIAACNDQLVKLAKASGELVWHEHDAEDELFLVLAGRLTLQFRDAEVVLDPGEMYVVPRGVEHCPRAEPGTHILLIEPATTAHTGDTVSPRSVAMENQLWI